MSFLSKFRDNPKPTSQPEKQYCWQFLHPIAGWCGGGDDDHWSRDFAAVELNASFCEYPTKILTRDKPANYRPAKPGSIRPSIVDGNK